MFLLYNTGKSWWPLLMSFFIFYTFLNFLNYLLFKNKVNFSLSLILLLCLMMMWFQDLNRESYYLGGFNIFMQMTFKLGMIFFILSEFMFFFSFFWAYFHFMFMFDLELGLSWPPISINKVDYMAIPLLNTLLLLTSGMTLTLSHNFFMSMNNKKTYVFLLMTILMGAIFTLFQSFEYYYTSFMWSSGAYGSIFYMGTGFHGLHVLIGTIMLSVLLLKCKLNKLTMNSNIFDLVAWYWHFVDMIWLVLFTEFYWWTG